MPALANAQTIHWLTFIDTTDKLYYNNFTFSVAHFGVEFDSSFIKMLKSLLSKEGFTIYLNYK